MKLIIFLVLLGVASSSSPFSWQKFKRDYNKHYKSVFEDAERKLIFYQNVNQIRVYQRTHPDATFTLAINHLADRRIEELVSRSKLYVEPRPENMESSVGPMTAPDSFDWRTKGVITTVKNEGVMGQAEAMVAVEVVESLNAIKTKKLEAGSFARVVDCCPQPNDPFICITKLGGICHAGDYPATTGQCLPNKCTPFAHFDKITRLKSQNEDTMVTWIQNSTLFVGIDASRTSFQLYDGGIYNDPTCSKSVIDHTMQLVGYGKTSSGELYWICRNSWGATWGEQGYMRVLRGKNICGIATYVTQVA